MLQCIYILKQAFNTELNIRTFYLMCESTALPSFRKEGGIPTLHDSYVLDIHFWIGILGC